MASPVDRRLLGESRAARTQLVLAALLGILSAVLIIAQAVLLAYVIDRAAMYHATVTVLEPELIALAAVLLSRAVVNGGFELSGRLGAHKVMSELRGRLACHLLLVCPGGIPAGERTGDLAAAAVQGVDALESYFAGYLPQLVLATVVPLAVLGWTATVDPISAGILALTMPILIVFMILIGKGASSQARRRWQSLSLLSAHFLDVVRGLPTLRAYRREHAQAQILADVGERYRTETMATLRVAFLSALVLELCAMIGTALVAATIGVQLVYGDARPAGRADGAAARPGAVRTAAQRRPAVSCKHRRHDHVRADLRGPRCPATRRPIHPRRHARASRTPPATGPGTLKDLLPRRRLRVPGAGRQRRATSSSSSTPGEITALLGPSGAGKSTIAQAGDAPCRPDARAHHLRRRRPARPRPRRLARADRMGATARAIFAGTIAENIRLGAPHADAAQLEQAATAAGASRSSRSSRRAWRRRSGRPRAVCPPASARRIALARAFLRDARLLVLDEPTANLDETNANTIADALTRLAAGRTTLLIVHHPALAEHADRVLRLDAGRLSPETPVLQAPSMPVMEAVS